GRPAAQTRKRTPGAAGETWLVPPASAKYAVLLSRPLCFRRHTPAPAAITRPASFAGSTRALRGRALGYMKSLPVPSRLTILSSPITSSLARNIQITIGRTSLTTRCLRPTATWASAAVTSGLGSRQAGSRYSILNKVPPDRRFELRQHSRAGAFLLRGRVNPRAGEAGELLVSFSAGLWQTNRRVAG